MKQTILYLLFMAGFAVILKAQHANDSRLIKNILKGKADLLALYKTRGVEKQFICDDLIDNDSGLVSLIQKRVIQNSERGVLFYFYSEPQLEICLISENKSVFATASIGLDSLLNWEQQYRIALGVEALQRERRPVKRGLKQECDSFFGAYDLPNLTQKISRVFFPPEISSALHGLKNLIIQPALNIGLFPFAALKPFHSDTSAYLIDSLSYSISPHICQLFSIRNSTYWNQEIRFVFENPLLIGDPIYYTNDYYVPALDGAKREVEKIHASIGGKKLIGQDATLTEIKKYSQEADLLYFATHAICDQNNSLDSSFLMFTPDSGSRTGYWTTREIQNQTFLKADLAILSACQTGNGKIVDAGYIGLGRAFFKAGIANSIVSLWNVDDLATESLMVKFIENMREPTFYFPSEPLRKAMLEQRKQTPAPKYWAPFMVFGFGY